MVKGYTSPKLPRGATDIRYEADRCPKCRKRDLYVSYLLAGQYSGVWLEKEYVSHDGVVMQTCGFMCLGCGWGNAGARFKVVRDE